MCNGMVARGSVNIWGHVIVEGGMKAETSPIPHMYSQFTPQQRLQKRDTQTIIGVVAHPQSTTWSVGEFSTLM